MHTNPSPFCKANLSATFTVAPNGRGKIAISPNLAGNPTLNYVSYLRNNGTGLVLEQLDSNGATEGLHGNFSQQFNLQLPVQAATLNGPFIVGTEIATALIVNASAPLSVIGGSDNSGSFMATPNGDLGVLGSPVVHGPINGTFTVVQPLNPFPGRGTATTTNDTIFGGTHAALYISSPGNAVAIGTDPLGTTEPQIIFLDQ